MSASTNHGGLRAVISPSILSGDFAHLAADCRRLLDCGADWLHIDVMDGHFVPNLTIGAPVLAALKKALPDAHYDVHLMVARPEQWAEDFVKAGASNYTFHVEATEDPAKLIQRIRELGMKPGITLRPGTPLSAILPFVPSVDLVLVMSVEPGFGGQAFMPDQMDKVRALRAQFPQLDIQVDGGVGEDTIAQCAEAGANVIVSGSAIFKSKDMADTIRKLREPVDNKIKEQNKQ